MHGVHRIGKSDRLQGLIHVQSRLFGMFKQPKQHAGRAKLQRLRHIHTVCVADNHMQSAIFVGAMRFVPRVDDRPVERGLETDFHMEVVGTLAELVACGFAPLANADADLIP